MTVGRNTPPAFGGVCYVIDLGSLAASRELPSIYRHFLATRFLRAFLGAPLTLPEIAKSSSFLPDLIAAASHRGFRPRPAQVSPGFSGLRYFGATFPRAPLPPTLARPPPES